VTPLSRLRDRALAFPASDDGPACRCRPSFEAATGATDRGTELRIDGDDCPGEGDLAAAPACRETVVSALAERDAGVVRTCAGGLERTYDGDAAALLLAAGRFVERVTHRDEALADRARRDPLAAAREATGRAGTVPDLAAETGLAESAARVDGYGDLNPYVGPSVARSRVRRRPPADATLAERRDLDTGATVRRYETGAGPHYHLDPPSRRLDAAATATLAAAAAHLAEGAVDGGARAPGRAVRQVADGTDPVATLTRVLRRHTRGLGVLEHLFADPRVSDVFATAPVAETPLRVTADGDRLPTNVRLTPDGAAALASRLRRASGRSFSRADPTVDAVVDPDGPAGEVRVAGVAAPASDGHGFAFRSHGDDGWTLPALVANGTVTPDAAGLLSVAVERGAAALVAGPRSAGKTTLLSALLWELPARTRCVVVEDTPELPVDVLRTTGRDVQAIRVDPGDGPEIGPTEALRTALRLGSGALVVGEVRGEEAGVLYESMRVGASESAVLGTIHGDGAPAVRERVVSDLGVPASSFAATDLVVTCTVGESRHVGAVTEVRNTDQAVAFARLFDRGEDGLSPTGVVDRGNSHLAETLARPDESYADVRAAVSSRAAHVEELAATGLTAPDEVTAANRTERC
jgi:type IV secretory pathway ATPase VirB11/archaellum biosynthesis ATPase